MRTVEVATVAELVWHSDPTGLYSPVRVTLRYDEADPYGVHVVFHCADEDVPWGFCRRILAEGFAREAGGGDVTVRRAGNTVELHLRSDDGGARYLLPAADIRRFLRLAERLVPYGRERVDVDDLVDRILDWGGVR